MELENTGKFNHPLFGSLTTITNESQDIFFIGKEVCDLLGYSNASKTISDHCKGYNKTLLPSIGGNQESIIIPERDLYRLVMRSKKPEAEKFEEWVVAEVLPSIRKTGKFEVATIPSYQIENPAERARAWAVEYEEKLLLQETNTKLQYRSDFVDVCFDTDGVFSMEETCKILKLPYGRNTMLQKLRELKVFLKSNTPSQKFISNGYFKVVENIIENGEFKKLVSTTYATQKGIGYIHKILNT